MAPPGTEHEQQPHHQEEEKTGQHIRDGDCLPLDGITFYIVGKDDKPQGIPAKEIFLGKRVAVISIPGAFTPVLSSRHVPGYIDKQQKLKSKGKLDEIVCISTNDPFVQEAWGKSFGAGSEVRFLSDMEKTFAKATGLGCELFGTTRLKRFSMLCDDGVVKKVNVESENNNLGVSSADHMLELVGA